jgi:hypothetical protein
MVACAVCKIPSQEVSKTTLFETIKSAIILSQRVSFETIINLMWYPKNLSFPALLTVHRIKSSF